MLPLGPTILDPIIAIAFRFPSSAVAVLPVRSGLQRSVITKLFKDSGTHLTNLFLTVEAKDTASGSFEYGKSTLTFQSAKHVNYYISIN